ncbi:hypothetical protein ACIQOW_06080 [Kitasatospora sp. NPDC091335]|uniref:hypothetical protein n=1 Tax=Streptomycetaceae TaxID=2062 RepID=UPI001661A829|nr:hypothetical protein [Streptomyces sp. CBMA156]MBD0670727.1 hypothetical protein [Streptomyces sp. CBMA156]
MPGSLTISHHESAVALDHADAERLATVLAELAYLLEIPGPNRINDAQLAVLCEGRAPDRGELVHWCASLARGLKGQL